MFLPETSSVTVDQNFLVQDDFLTLWP